MTHVAGIPDGGEQSYLGGMIDEGVLDIRTYEKGIKITKGEMASLAITGDAFHPEWNYTIKPRRSAET